MSKKVKTLRQIRYLLSDNTPLTPAQVAKLRRELKSGKVKVKKQ